MAEFSFSAGNGTAVTVECKDQDSVEYKIALVRMKRNKLIADTDWRGNPDIVMSDVWKTYRQTLRDLMKNIKTDEDIKNITWPTKPD